MSGAVMVTADEAARLAQAVLADLDRLRHADQPLLASAATRAHAALKVALASSAPDALEPAGA
ncbi:MAG TPA: hypothetical protein VHL53_13270 [Acidimicrobiia bacterium]|nr:hypothetical protein [Acidimicrobiia bacterium]